MLLMAVDAKGTPPQPVLAPGAITGIIRHLPEKVAADKLNVATDCNRRSTFFAMETSDPFFIVREVRCVIVVESTWVTGAVSILVRLPQQVAHRVVRLRNLATWMVGHITNDSAIRHVGRHFV